MSKQSKGKKKSKDDEDDAEVRFWTDTCI